jgi:hypothetical protein
VEELGAYGRFCLQSFVCNAFLTVVLGHRVGKAAIAISDFQKPVVKIAVCEPKGVQKTIR